MRLYQLQCGRTAQLSGRREALEARASAARLAASGDTSKQNLDSIIPQTIRWRRGAQGKLSKPRHLGQPLLVPRNFRIQPQFIVAEDVYQLLKIDRGRREDFGELRGVLPMRPPTKKEEDTEIPRKPLPHCS
jgi:hypothetical protein